MHAACNETKTQIKQPYWCLNKLSRFILVNRKTLQTNLHVHFEEQTIYGVIMMISMIVIIIFKINISVYLRSTNYQ